jgi:hypothetical protein
MIAILYGSGFSFIIQYLKKTENFDYQTVFFIMNAILAFSIILKGYFPQYIPFYNIFLNAYPLKSYQKSIGILIYDFITIVNFLPLVFCFTVFICMDAYNITQFSISLLTIVIFFTIEKLLKFSLKIGAVFLLALGLVTAISLLYFYGYYKLIQSENIIILGVIFLSLACFTIYTVIYERYSIAENSMPVRKHNRIAAKQLEKSFAWESLTKKRALFNTLLIGFGFKIIIVTIIITALLNKNNGLTNSAVIVSLICSPVVFFNYVFNNIFGYKPQIFLHVGYKSAYKEWLLYYIKNILLFLIIDFSISFLVLSFVYSDFAIIDLIYLIFLYCTLTAYGFIASILLPKKVTNALSFTRFKSNTSMSASFGIIIFTIVSFNIYKTPSFFIPYVALNCLIIWYFFHVIINKHSDKRYIAVIKKIF